MKSLKPLVLILGVVIIDQCTKYLAGLYLSIHFNQGISLGLFNQYPFLTLLASVVIMTIITVVLFFKKPRRLINFTALLLLLSGGISNTIDRVYNHGAVIDWIKIGFFPVFNLADVAITTGVLLIIYNIVIMNHLIPKIIFEDGTLVVIDKPAGLTVDRASTNRNVVTVQDWIDKKYNNSPAIASDLIYDSGDFKNRSGIVHRLDKETSGVLLVAKTKEAFTNLQSQFKNREITKKYLALVHGKVEPSQGTINVPIERNPYNKKKFGVFLGGKEALTEYKTIAVYRHSGDEPPVGGEDSRINNRFWTSQNDEFSYLEISPHTGRTHQIRIHLKYINYPIVGDILYSGRKNIALDKRICPRMFLHAGYLKIKHPKTGMNMEFNCELPEELQEVLNKLFII